MKRILVTHLGLLCLAGSLLAEDHRTPSVGAAGTIGEIILPGSELAAKPIDQQTVMVVRIVHAFPHGDGFRYRIRFHGLEPGKYDLARWLVRKDGSSTADLPEIPVEIRSLLPPGQVQPNELEAGWLPRLGGYRVVMITAVIVWCLGLLALIFVGRKKSTPPPQPARQATLADLLHARLQAAFENRSEPQHYAELERMLLAFWRKRLQLDTLPADQAMAKIREHDQAGPLMKQLEQWMHHPSARQRGDLASLLEPFRELPADAREFDP